MTPVIPDPPFDQGDNLIALCVWREARGAPYAAKLGVVWTLRNRCAMAPQQGFKPTMAENILKPWAFSSFNPNDPNSHKYPPSLEDPVWLDCLKAVNDPAPDPTGGAVFYFSRPLTEPPAAWGPVSEAPCIGGIHFCVIDEAPKPVT
jgi:hypothetical protein